MKKSHWFFNVDLLIQNENLKVCPQPNPQPSY